MQDRYAGNVGDFGKFGLLRHPCGKTARVTLPRLKPGVIWYRVADETHNGDGRHISYLKKSAKSVKDRSVEDDNDPRFRDCDADLYDALKKMVFPEWKRSLSSIGALERLDLLSSKTANCDLILVDPDNGLAWMEGSPKHVSLHEIRSLVQRKPGPSVVIYHHVDHLPGTAEEKTEHQPERLSNELRLPPFEQPFAVLFRRWGVRAFLILPSQENREMLLGRTNALIQKWGKDEWGKPTPKPHFTGPIPTPT